MDVHLRVYMSRLCVGNIEAVFILFDFPTISAVLAYGNGFVKGFAPVYI